MLYGRVRAEHAQRAHAVELHRDTCPDSLPYRAALGELWIEAAPPQRGRQGQPGNAVTRDPFTLG